ncbi:MAG: monofunctional biosynthetic peptidoglycan transglycosylase [Porphyromonadaceae bacterium]|nr:monofunctional biosynthetic peptidoglycan transglycosylase [Porphyromonadaceae bacterium]
MRKIKSKKHKNNSFIAKLSRFVGKLILWFFIISISWVVLARFLPVWVTPLMLIRSVEAIADGEKPKIKKEWVSIDKISPNMIQAVVAAEDNLFMSHNGFSFDAIEKAYKHNKKGKRIRGGSTISQQTAKNVFLWPHRSWVRKGFEAYFTVLIELVWSKKRIMEVYLNVIEMGDGIYGVQAASKTYFNVNASKLANSQAALIAVCLPNPRRYNPAKPSSYIQRRKNQILSLMRKIERVSFED